MITIYFVENNRLAVCPSRSKGADLSFAIFVCVVRIPQQPIGEHGIALPLWRNRLAHLPSKQGVAGSSPAKEHGVLFKILTFTGDSSVGRAVDCRSIGRVFDSPSPDLLYGRNCLNKSNKQ